MSNNLKTKTMVKTLRIMMLALVATVCNGAWADAYKTLTFPDDGEEGGAISAYTKTWNAKKGNDTWIISNFNTNKWNNWSYIKCGRKDNASEATITTGFKIDKKISTVVVTIDKVTEADKVNKIQLLSASDEAFGDVISAATVESVKAGELQFKLDANGGQLAENLYYKLIFDCAAAEKNGVIQISKIQYFEEGNEPVIADIANTPETAYTVAKAHELIAAGEGLATKVYVKGIITKIDETTPENLAQYGNMTYYINDTNVEEGSLMVFRGYYIKGADGKDRFTSADQIKVGDEVIVYGNLVNYNGTHEFNSGSQIYSLNGTTGIEDIHAAQTGETVIYNLNGQRLQKMQKGINIVNGKKVLMK